MQELICFNGDLSIGGRRYEPGDLIETQQAMTRGDLNERLVDTLQRQARIRPLTRENFDLAIRRRDPALEFPPAGFTRAYLLEKGIIDAEAVATADPEAAKAPAGKKKGPPAASAPRIDEVKPTDQSEAVGPYFMTPNKRGNFLHWSVTDADGKLLRDRAFKDKAKAIEFLTGLMPAQPADGGEAEDANDGGDIRSEPGDQP